MQNGTRNWLAPAAGLTAGALFLATIEWAARRGLVSPFLMPPPSEIAAAGWRIAGEEPLASAFLTTLLLALGATAAAALVGIAGGWLLYRFKAIGSAYESWLAALFSAPLILLYPLFLVLFGRGMLTLFMIGFLSGVIPMLLKTYEGFNSVRRVLINVARSFNLSERSMLMKVLLPAALPTVFTGLRLAFIYATINVIGLEYLANLGGLGFMIGRMYDRFDIPAMYATVSFVLLLSVIGFYTAERLERAFAGGGHGRQGQA